MPAALRRQLNLPWLVLLFIGSGCAALIYEVVWLQLLQLVIGLTSVSLGVLLGVYMGGMSLGSLLLARFVSSRRNPLRVYAVLELGIALTGVGVLFLVPWLSDLYTRFGGPGFAGIVLRAFVAAVCLLPPTVLMGATLPAIARYVESTSSGVAWLGIFYGGNIFGAVVGCLAAGFYLLRVFDMATATYVAASINIVVALLALALTRSGSSTPTPEREQPVEVANTPTGSKLIYVLIGLSGLSALGAEIVWTRLLSLLFGGTVYTFSLLLAVFLAGLGLGSSAGSLLARMLGRPQWALGACQFLLTAAIAWSAFAITQTLPYWSGETAAPVNPWRTFQFDFARALWAMLPAALLWGASFPLALAVVTRGQPDPGRVVGRLYAANTLGAITGALLFSLVIVPWVGTHWAQRILVLICGGTAILAFAPARRSAEPGAALKLWPRLAGAALVLGFAFVLAWSVAPAPWGLIAYGRHMTSYGDRLAPGVVAEDHVPPGGNPDIFATYVGEGLNGSVAVTKWTSGVRNFHSAGKVQASSDPRDMRLQRMLGHLSALTVTNPESVLVVACGAGVTAGSFVVHPEVKRIVICDIEPLVPAKVAPMFAQENFNVVNDPRTQVVIDDGRHFIRTTKEKFDVITSDPIDPWVKGCAALNTLEYYEMCKQHLKPGGVMSLWIPLYESDSATVKSSIATFFKAFPDGILFSNDDMGEGYDAVLLGQVGPTAFELDAMQERLDRDDHARVKQSLRNAGFPTMYSLFGTYAGQARDLEPWTRDGQINTDTNLRLQYLAGLSFNNYIGSEILDEILQYRRFPEGLFPGSTGRTTALRLAIMGPDKSP